MSGKKIADYCAPPGNCAVIALDASGKKIAGDNFRHETVQVWNAEQPPGATDVYLGSGGYRAKRLAFNADRNLLSVLDRFGVRIWDTKTRTKIGSVADKAFSDDNSLYICQHEDRTTIWRLGASRMVFNSAAESAEMLLEDAESAILSCGPKSAQTVAELVVSE